MNARLLIFALSASAAGLVACGGGGGGTSPIPNPGGGPTSNPTSQPTAAASYPPRPSGAGDAFAFTGTLTRKDSYTYPQPNPLPSTSASAAVTQSVTVVATSVPYGSGPVADFQTTESDVYAQQTLSSKSDLYFQSGKSAFTLLGSQSVDDAGNVTKTQYATPQTVDMLPETAGATWSNSPAATIAQQFAGGETDSRTVAKDGSYTDTEHIDVGASPNPASTNFPEIDAALRENADGSGSFSIVHHENGNANYPPDTDIYTNYLISAPVAQSSNANYLNFSYQTYDVTAGASPSPAPTPSVIASFPVWYAQPLALYSEKDTDSGPQPIPADCKAPSAFGTKAVQITQNVTSVDTILGTQTTTLTNQYVAGGFGPVCVTISTNIAAYYDYNLDTIAPTGPIFYQGSTPLQSTSISEVLTLAQQAPQAKSGGRRAMSALTPIGPGEIANARLHVQQFVERDRAKRIKAMARSLFNRRSSKGVRA